jgi:integrase
VSPPSSWFEEREKQVWRRNYSLWDIPRPPVGCFARAWGTAKEAADIECRWHDLRHSAASRIAAGGATDQTPQALLGWMSPKTIEKYSHVRAEAKRKAVSVFDNAGSIQ